MTLSSDSFWEIHSHTTFANEASVETGLILPLLHALGYVEAEHISPKHPVEFREGRKGRKPEADFVIFSERPHSKANSLIVIEAKRPGEALTDAKAQAESYSSNLKTPLFVVTNGEDFEVWQNQPTLESERLIGCAVKDLPGQRGAIESLLTHDAAITLCKTLAFKNFNLLARDLSAYERAEFEREPSTCNLIVRRLREKDGKTEVSSNSVLQSYDAGAIVTAPSGYGKTSLSSQMRCQAIEQRWMGENDRLPIEIFIPDAPPNQPDFEQFLRDRIAAHCPQMTAFAVRDLLRQNGAILLCDGFDRVTHETRSKFDGVLANFRRDYPKSQVFLFTRPSTLPERLALTSLEMCDLNPDEQDSMIGKFWKAHPQPHCSTRNDAAVFLKSLWKFPLFLKLTLETHLAKKKLPTDIEPLFRNWLDRIVPASVPFGKRAEMTEILKLVASETAISPLSEFEILSLVRSQDFSEEALQQLVDNDAFTKRGDMLEVRHEALADYLRALDIVRRSPREVAERLEQISIGSGSQLAQLMMATAQSADIQRLVWTKVASQNLSAAISSLRYRADLSRSFDTNAEARSERYLSDIMDGIRVPLLAHFGPFSKEICSWLSGTTTSHTSIVGAVSDNGNSVSYTFIPSNSWEERPTVGITASGRSYYRSLKLSGLRLDSGQLVGMMHLKDAVMALISKRRLKGGLIWAEERTIGRLHHLMRHYEFPDIAHTDLAGAARILDHHAGQWVTNSSVRSGQTFEINDLIEDIQILLDSGMSALVPWWQKAYPIDVISNAGQKRLATAFHEH